VSRTQYQYSLEDADAAELNTFAPKLMAALSKRPELRDVSSDEQDAGLRAALTIDRDTASRFGISPQLIDDTLYDAFGQRQISTMFTQLNQYRVVLEVTPDVQRHPDASTRSTSAARTAGRCRCRPSRAWWKPPGRWRSITRSNFRW